MSTEAHNDMQAPQPGDEVAAAVFNKIKEDVHKDLHRIHRESVVHHLHLHEFQELKDYTIKIYAIEHTAYGTNWFAKIHIGHDPSAPYIHVRAETPTHKHLHGHHAAAFITEKVHVIFHAIHVDHQKKTCLWTESDPLKFFSH